MKAHVYESALKWSGSTGAGYARYGREHVVSAGRSSLSLSADQAFLGDASLPNPEQLLLAAASSCQLLSFLAVAARAGVDVIDYRDEATAIMPSGSHPMRITEIILSPTVTVRQGEPERIVRLMHDAHAGCYIAHSLAASVEMDITVEVAP
ncbi:OsmC family protein [Microbacterium ureisolvens]|uniref:OsmC family protein n=1 Tax=Microbacterium ureisolvens TaxID=2781186 RepID=UPI0036281DDA